MDIEKMLKESYASGVKESEGKYADMVAYYESLVDAMRDNIDRKAEFIDFLIRNTGKI